MGPTTYAPPRPSRPFPAPNQLTMAPYYPMMNQGIGGLFSRLQGMDDETFSRGMDRYGAFRERFGGGFQPNMFGTFARMDDEGFSRGMDRLGAYAERFGAGNPMFRNYQSNVPMNGDAGPVTGGQTPYPVDGPGSQPSYQPPVYGRGPATQPYYNTGFGSANPYMPRNPYASGYGMGYNSYSGGQSPFGRSGGMGGGKGGGNPYSGRPAGGGKGGGQSGGGFGPSIYN